MSTLCIVVFPRDLQFPRGMIKGILGKGYDSFLHILGGSIVRDGYSKRFFFGGGRTRYG